MILSLVNTCEELTGISHDSPHLCDCFCIRLIPQEHRLKVVCNQRLSSYVFRCESQSPLRLVFWLICLGLTVPTSDSLGETEYFLPWIMVG